MNFKIVSDSSSNLLQFTGVNYAAVPLKIRSAKAEYVDDAGLDVAAMVEELKNTKGKSSTSCPNIQEWIDAFGGAKEVFAITITSNLSGSYNAAKQAADIYMAEDPEAKVYVVDSLSAGPELTLLVETLAQLHQDGCEFEQKVEFIQQYQQNTHLLFCLESLTNLARNGRVNPAVAKIAGVLGIRVVGKASDVGTLQQLHKCRGEKKALETMFAEMEAMGFAGGKVRLDHCQNPDAAKALKDMILEKYPYCDIQIGQCRGLCSFYAEQGGLMLGFESV